MFAALKLGTKESAKRNESLFRALVLLMVVKGKGHVVSRNNDLASMNYHQGASKHSVDIIALSPFYRCGNRVREGGGDLSCASH